MVHVVPAAIDENVQIVEGGSIGGHLSEVDKHAESVAIVRNVLWNPQLRRRVAQIKIACAIVRVNVQLIRVVFQTEVLAVPPIQRRVRQRSRLSVPLLFLKRGPKRLIATDKTPQEKQNIHQAWNQKLPIQDTLRGGSDRSVHAATRCFTIFIAN